jgi:hypothetical protein
MSQKSSLQISRHRAQARTSPQQERFQFLIAEIEKVRRARAAWDATALEFKQTEAARLQPLKLQLRTVTRDTVLRIDALLEQSGWSRIDQATLKDILRFHAKMLLDTDSSDLELKAVFDKHGPSFDDLMREDLEKLKEHAAEFMGIDLDAAEIGSEEELIERVYQHMAQREQRQEEKREAQDRRRKKSAAQQRAESSAEAAKKFLREIYRKLASAVHPDREADAARREEKNELMQRINRAYATNDLLTLLEAQLRLQQIDPEHVASMSAERLKQYNKLLSEQLERAKVELRQLEDAFRADHGLQYERLTPQSLEMVIRYRAREIRERIKDQKHFLELLANKSMAKRWLKERRAFDRLFGDEYDEE